MEFNTSFFQNFRWLPNQYNRENLLYFMCNIKIGSWENPKSHLVCRRQYSK